MLSVGWANVTHTRPHFVMVAAHGEYRWISWVIQYKRVLMDVLFLTVYARCDRGGVCNYCVALSAGFYYWDTILSAGSFQCEHTIKWNYTLAYTRAAWIIWGSCENGTHCATNQAWPCLIINYLLLVGGTWTLIWAAVVKSLILGEDNEEICVDISPFSRPKISQSKIARATLSDMHAWKSLSLGQTRTQIWVSKVWFRNQTLKQMESIKISLIFGQYSRHFLKLNWKPSLWRKKLTKVVNRQLNS